MAIGIRMGLGLSAQQRRIVNLSPVSSNFASAKWLKASENANFTYDVTTGSDVQGEFIDYRLNGSAASQSALFIFSPFPPSADITNGLTYTGSAIVERVAGAWTGISAVRVGLTAYTAANTYITENTSIQTNFSGPRLLSASLAMTAPTAAKADASIFVIAAANTAIDITLRFRQLQLYLT
jgi:hypothetical protein